MEIRCEELAYGQEKEALSFLLRDPVRNLRMVWALRDWGLFNIGLPEQGRFLAARGADGMEGMLFLNNLGVMRLAATGEAARELVEEALARWRGPELLAGPESEVEALLREVRGLREAVVYRERELSLLLEGGGLPPCGEKARFAREEDIEDLALLEGMMQEEMLGRRAAGWVVRSEMSRAVERGQATLVEVEGKVVAKAEIDASTPDADELGGVFVLPRWRRKGYGTAACALLCWASLAQGKKVRLETQRDNRSARRFYAGLGFRPLWPHLAVRLQA